MAMAVPARAATVVAIAWSHIDRHRAVDGTRLVVDRSGWRIVDGAGRRHIYRRGRHVHGCRSTHHHARHAHADGQAHTAMGLSRHTHHQTSNSHSTCSQNFCHLGESCLEHHNLLFLIELGRPTNACGTCDPIDTTHENTIWMSRFLKNIVSAGKCEVMRLALKWRNELC